MMEHVLTLMLICVSGIYSADSETGLKVVPPNIAVQVGQTVSLKCQHYPADPTEDLKLEWFMPDGTIPVSQLNINQTIINTTNSEILRYKSENGTLTIENATLADAGTYKCKKLDALEIETLVKVYVMPKYTTEIIVVLAINAILVVIFIICALSTFIREKRAEKKSKREQKLGHKVMVST